MKKFLATLLVLVMSIFAFASCSLIVPVEPEEPAATLEDAASYLYKILKDNEGDATPKDYNVVAKILIDGTEFTVTWTVDNEAISIVEGKPGYWTVDVPSANEAEFNYNLTATIKDAAGATTTKSFGRKMPVLQEAPVVDSKAPVVGEKYNMAFAHGNLENKVYYVIGGMDGHYMATSDDASAAVNFYVEEVEGGYNLYCINWGEKLYLNMVISGSYINAAYEETASTVYTYDAELDTLVATVNGASYMFGTSSAEGKEYKTIGPVAANADMYYYAHLYASELADQAAPVVMTPEEIVNAAWELEPGATLEGGPRTLTGIITSIDDAYSAQYKNITVTMVVAGLTDKPIVAYRLKGEGADQLAVGDQITVTGTIVNYANEDETTGEIISTLVEFTSGCTLDAWVDNTTGSEDPDPIVPVDPVEMTVAEALAAADGTKVIITGTVTIASVWDSYWGNMNVTIEDETGSLYVYRLAAEVAVGDKIKVTGEMTTYEGARQIAEGATAEIIEKAPVVEPEPEDPIVAPEGGNLVDLDTLAPVDGTSKDTSYVDRTTTSGWTATGARSDEQADFGEDAQIILNGKTTALGTLVSPLLKGGIKTIYFEYGNAFGESNGVSVKINIKDKDGNVLATTDCIDTTVDKLKGEAFIWNLETAIAGDFVIEILNNSPTNSTSNKDRVSLWNIIWVSNDEGTEPPVEVPTSGEFTATITDNNGFFDLVTFTAPKAGKYTFSLPAGIGAWDQAACEAYSADPYFDFYGNTDGASFDITLEEGETYGFYIGAVEKNIDVTITWSWAEAGSDPVDPEPDEPVESVKDANGLGGTYTFSFVMEYTLVFTPNAEGATVGTLDVTDPVNTQYSGTYIYTIDETGAYVITSPNAIISNDGMNWTFQNPGMMMAQPFAEMAGSEQGGDTTEGNVLVVGSNSVVISDADVTAGSTTATFAPTVSGEYGFTGDLFITSVVDGTGAAVSKNANYKYDLIVGNTYTLTISTTFPMAYSAGTYALNVTYTEPVVDATEIVMGDNTIVFTEDEIAAGKIELPLVVAEQTLWELGTGLTVSVLDANGQAIEMNSSWQYLLDAGTYTVVIETTGMTAGTTYYITAYVYEYIPPVEMVLGANAFQVEAYGDLNAIFSTPGTYVLSAAEGETNAFVMVPGEYGSELATLPYTFTLAEGESLTFNISANDWSAADEINLVLEAVVVAKDWEDGVIDFSSDDLCSDYIVIGSSTVTGPSIITAEDGNKYLEYEREAKGASIDFKPITSAEGANAIVWSADLKITRTEGSRAFSITFHTSSARAYMLELRYCAESGLLYVGDKSESSDAIGFKSGYIKPAKDIVLGDWFNIQVKYYDAKEGDNTSVRMVTSVNGEVVLYSNNWYGATIDGVNSNAVNTADIAKVQVFPYTSHAGTFALDNVVFDKVVAEAPTDPVTILYDNYDGKSMDNSGVVRTDYVNVDDRTPVLNGTAGGDEEPEVPVEDTYVAPVGSVTFADMAEGDWAINEDGTVIINHYVQSAATAENKIVSEDGVKHLSLDKTAGADKSSQTWALFQRTVDVAASEALVFEAKMRINSTSSTTSSYLRFYDGRTAANANNGTAFAGASNAGRNTNFRLKDGKIEFNGTDLTVAPGEWFVLRLTLSGQTIVAEAKDVGGNVLATVTVDQTGTWTEGLDLANCDCIVWMNDSATVIDMDFQSVYFGGTPVYGEVEEPEVPVYTAPVGAITFDSMEAGDITEKDFGLSAGAIAGVYQTPQSAVIGNKIVSDDDGKYLQIDKSLPESGSSTSTQSWINLALNADEVAKLETMVVEFKIRINMTSTGSGYLFRVYTGERSTSGGGTRIVNHTIASGLTYQKTDIGLAQGEWATVRVEMTDYNAETAANNYKVSVWDAATGEFVEKYATAISAMTDINAITCITFMDSTGTVITTDFASLYVGGTPVYATEEEPAPEEPVVPTYTAPAGAMTFDDMEAADWTTNTEGHVLLGIGKQNDAVYTIATVAEGDTKYLSFDKTGKAAADSSVAMAWLVVEKTAEVAEGADLVFEARMSYTKANGNAHIRLYNGRTASNASNGTEIAKASRMNFGFDGDYVTLGGVSVGAVSGEWFTLRFVVSGTTLTAYAVALDGTTTTLATITDDAMTGLSAVQFTTASNDYVTFNFDSIYFGAAPVVAE